MNILGVGLAMIATLCMVVSIYHVNFKHNMRLGFQWTGFGYICLVFALVLAQN